MAVQLHVAYIHTVKSWLFEKNCHLLFHINETTIEPTCCLTTKIWYDCRLLKKSHKNSRNMYCHCHSLLSSLSSRSLKVMLISGLVVTYVFVAFAQGVARQSILKEISSSTAVSFTSTFAELDISRLCRWIKTKPKGRNLHAYIKCSFVVDLQTWPK